MIESFRSKALLRFWTKGDASAVRPEWRKKTRILLDALDSAAAPADMSKPGFGFLALSGAMAGRFSVIVSRNWRVTFGWSGDNATEVDLEDYHGS
jgi:proteic killer suppression protein